MDRLRIDFCLNSSTIFYTNKRNNKESLTFCSRNTVPSTLNGVGTVSRTQEAITGASGLSGGSPLGTVTGVLGGSSGGPLGAVTGVLGGSSGGPLGAVTDVLGAPTGDS